MSDEKQLTLDDAITAAMDNPTPEPDPAPIEADTDTAPVETDAKSERVRDEKGRFAPKTTDTIAEPVAAEAPAEPVTSTEPTPTETPPDAPKLEVSEGHFRGWTQEQKAKFQSLPPEAQDVVLALKRDTDSHYTRKLEEAAHFRKTVEPALQTLSQHADLFAAQNMTPLQAFEGYANIERTLTYGTFKDKVDLIGKICERYGVPFAPDAGLGTLDPYQAETYPALHDRDAEIARERAEKQQLKSRLDRIEAERHQQTIQAFATATNPDGTPRHPHFEAVKTMMGTLLQRGQAQTLDEAYALASKPIQDAIDAAKAAERAAFEARQKEAVEKAKRAAPVKASASAPNGKPVGKVSLDEMLDQALSQAGFQ